MQTPRCGDHVHHRPSDEKWVVAYADEGTGEMAWAGWPDGVAKLSDCELVYRCSDEEHAEAVKEWLKSSPSHRRGKVERMYGDHIKLSI